MNNENLTVTEPQEEREEREVKVYVDNNPEPKISMKWFGFYKVVLVIWAVCYGIYGVLSCILAVINNQGSGLYAAVMAGLGLFSLALGALCLYLFLNLRKYSRKAYKINMWFIIILGILGAAGSGLGIMAMLLSGFGKVGAVAFGVIYAALGLIYPLCSIVYFEKRKHLFAKEKAVEEDLAEAEAGAEAEPEAESKRKSLLLRYLAAHIIVALISVVLIAALTPVGFDGYDPYGDYGDYGYLEPAEGSYEEEEADAAAVASNFDEAAVFLGYADADELMTEVEIIEAEDYYNEIDLHAMDIKEAYEFIFVEYFGCAYYEDALFAHNPYNGEVITSFTDYQEYVMLDLEAYFSEDFYYDYE